MHNRKILIVTLIQVTILIIITGCTPINYLGRDYDLFGVALSSVPGTGEFRPYINIIEVDTYGRTLFTVQVGSSLYGESNVGGLVYSICQKSDKNYTYYYDTVCYLPGRSLEEFTEDDIARLKEQNDWNKPLDENLMSKRELPSKSKQSGYIDFDKINYNVINDIASGLIGDKYDHIIRLVSEDYDGRLLIFIREYEHFQGGTLTEETKIVYNFYKSSYALILNPDGSYSENSIIELDDFYRHTEKLAELKKAVGWNLDMKYYND